MGDKMLTDRIGRNRPIGLLFRRMIESGEKPKQLVMITDTMVMRRGIDPQRASDVGAILIKRLFDTILQIPDISKDAAYELRREILDQHCVGTIEV